jgi:hypothetical protein
MRRGAAAGGRARRDRETWPTRVPPSCRKPSRRLSVRPQRRRSEAALRYLPPRVPERQEPERSNAGRRSSRSVVVPKPSRSDLRVHPGVAGARGRASSSPRFRRAPGALPLRPPAGDNPAHVECGRAWMGAGRLAPDLRRPATPSSRGARGRSRPRDQSAPSPCPRDHVGERRARESVTARPPEAGVSRGRPRRQAGSPRPSRPAPPG